MVSRFVVKGLKKVNNMIQNLPGSIKKEVGEIALRKIAVSGQRRIKRRYSALGYGLSDESTGFGFHNIIIRKLKKAYGILVPDYIELLDKPIRTHWVSLETIEAHQANPGSTMFKKAINVDLSRNPVTFRWRGPFITPALKSLNKDIPKILERATAKAIAGAMR